MVMERLTFGRDSQSQRSLILGCAVLAFSFVIVGVIYIGSTSPDVITKLRVYVNPEAARICGLARCGFSDCLAALGLIGFAACLYRARIKAKFEDQAKVDDCSLGLNEIWHLSYALHAFVVVCICVFGILSKRIAINPEFGILIELTPAEVSENDSVSAGRKVSVVPSNKKSPRGHSAVRSVVVQKTGAASHVVAKLPVSVKSFTKKDTAAPSVIAEVKAKSEALSMNGSEITNESQAVLPLATGKAYPRSFIVPNFETSLGNISSTDNTCAPLQLSESTFDGLSGNDSETEMGFDRTLFLPTYFSSGETFGVLSRNSVLGESFEVIPEALPIEAVQQQSDEEERESTRKRPERFSNVAPVLVRILSTDSGGLPLLAKRRRGVDISMVPPVPHRVSNLQDCLGMLAVPNVPNNDYVQKQDSEPKELKPTASRDWAEFATKAQARIYRRWYPPKICTSSPSEPIVSFSIASNGEVLNVRLKKSSGIGILDMSAIKAIEAASPLGALPQASKDTVAAEFTFTYGELGRLTPKYDRRLTPHAALDQDLSQDLLDVGSRDVCQLGQHLTSRVARVWSGPRNRGSVTMRFELGRDGSVSELTITQSSGNLLNERAAETALMNAGFAGFVDAPKKYGGYAIHDLGSFFDRLNCDSITAECQFLGDDWSADRIQTRILEVVPKRAKK